MELINDYEFDDKACLMQEEQVEGVDIVEDSHDDEIKAKREKNNPHDLISAAKGFHRFYFDEDHMKSESDFERRFHIPCVVFERIEKELYDKGELVLKRNKLGRQGVHPALKIIASLRVFMYGVFFGEMDESMEMSEYMTRDAFISSMTEMIEKFENEFMCTPNESDLARILRKNRI